MGVAFWSGLSDRLRTARAPRLGVAPCAPFHAWAAHALETAFQADSDGVLYLSCGLRVGRPFRRGARPPDGRPPCYPLLSEQTALVCGLCGARVMVRGLEALLGREYGRCGDPMCRTSWYWRQRQPCGHTGTCRKAILYTLSRTPPRTNGKKKDMRRLWPEAMRRGCGNVSLSRVCYVDGSIFLSTAQRRRLVSVNVDAPPDGARLLVAGTARFCHGSNAGPLAPTRSGRP